MTTEATTAPNVKERAVTVLYFASVYFFGTGALYLWGYWGTFEINFLEYIGFADILKSTAFPIASALLVAAAGPAVGEVYFGTRARLPHGGGRDTRIGRFLNKYLPKRIRLLVLLTIILELALYGGAFKWLVIPWLVAIPIQAVGVEKRLLAQVLPWDPLRSLAIYILAVLPFLAYGRGVIDADSIVKGFEYSYVLSPIDGLGVAKDDPPEKKPRFLGHTGDFLFFFDPVAVSVAISKFENGKALVLKKGVAPGVSESFWSRFYSPPLQGLKVATPAAYGASQPVSLPASAPEKKANASSPP